MSDNNLDQTFLSGSNSVFINDLLNKWENDPSLFLKSGLIGLKKLDLKLQTKDLVGQKKIIEL